MDIALHSEPDRRDPAPATLAPPTTLGDVLYAGRTKPPESEAHWVELVESIAAREELALHALYERTHRLVFTLVVRITGNRETAEELTLDIFHDIWRRAHRYDAANGTVLGWIMNQARSRAIDRLRFEQRKKRVDPRVDPAARDQLAEAPGAHHVLQFKEQSEAMRRALAILTPDERRAIETAFFSELNHAEVAARLNQPPGTIKTRIRSGLHKLRQALAGETGNA